MTIKEFNYESITMISEDFSLINFFHNKKDYFLNNKNLAVIYDDRSFKLHEKNFIKNIIEEFSFDSLKFTLRPSASRVLDSSNNVDERFRKLAAISFMLQSMARYDIDIAYISSRYIELKEGSDGAVCGDELYGYIEKWITGNSVLNKNQNTLCSINYLKNFSGNFKNKKIFFIENLTESENGLTYLKYNFTDQITPLEKDLFWMGFDKTYKDVPWNKPYPETKWTKKANESPAGEGYYEGIVKYCNRCCLPETMEGISFDEFGVCTPCRSSEQKMHVNWEDREAGLLKTLNNHKNQKYYDCILPISGGKDSTFQAHILVTKYKINPLSVTHGQNWYSREGRYNLENMLQKFDLDHLFFTASRSSIKKSATKSIDAIGDACWHCHIGAGAFVIQTAVKWGLELMIWGESIAEQDGRGSYYDQQEHSALYNVEVSALIRAEDYDNKNISKNELNQWYFPSEEKIKESKIRYLHLGDFIFWDEEKQVEFVAKEYEWMGSQVENAFKGYKSTECVMAGVHDYLNFLKRGVGRSTVQATDDVKRGIITRSEGMELAKKHDSQRPHALDFYMDITGLSEIEIENKIIKSRDLSDFAKKLNKEQKHYDK
jgi:N-acetyl sugar amidotransferase